MKVLSINLSLEGSTGKIMRYTQEYCKNRAIDYYISAPYDKSVSVKPTEFIPIGTREGQRRNAYISILTGLEGCFSYFTTKKYLRKVNKFSPDLIHFHNLHNYYINLPLLMKYVKKHQIPIVWTLHDCWSFTGHCPHFSFEKCEKWKEGCYNCCRYNAYPKSLYDNSKFMWKWKKEWFTGVEKMIIVTPSYWLANLVKSSYLKDYPVEVIHNGIDLSIFKPTESFFRKVHGLENKKIVLGVSFSWGERKGLDVFIKLAKSLPKDYQVILVGLDKEKEDSLPDNIITILRTHNQYELAEIYTAADVFVNPTREDNYPTVNMEAIACGTPVVSFRTGGSPETFDDTCGVVVEQDDLNALEREIIHICEKNTIQKTDCFNKSKKYDMNDRMEEYIAVYRSLCEELR